MPGIREAFIAQEVAKKEIKKNMKEEAKRAKAILALAKAKAKGKINEDPVALYYSLQKEYGSKTADIVLNCLTNPSTVMGKTTTSKDALNYFNKNTANTVDKNKLSRAQTPVNGGYISDSDKREAATLIRNYNRRAYRR